MADNTPKKRVHKKGGILFLLLGILLALSGTECAGQEVVDLKAEAQARETLERESLGHASVTYWGASAPIGHFLLIRKGTAVCALRFTGFHRGGDATQPTLFHSGDESLYATYDWYHQGDGSGDFTKSTVQSGRGEASRKAMVGIGRFAFARGEAWVKCGSIGLPWIYPNNVGFSSSMRDVGIELAPTKWREISEVNPHDPRLTWYRYDEQRKDILIPIDKLW